VSKELMQEKQRVDDLEEELKLLQKHLKTTQAKVAEQVNDNKSFFRFLKKILNLFSHKK